LTQSCRKVQGERIKTDTTNECIICNSMAVGHGVIYSSAAPTGFLPPPPPTPRASPPPARLHQLFGLSATGVCFLACGAGYPALTSSPAGYRVFQVCGVCWRPDASAWGSQGRPHPGLLSSTPYCSSPHPFDGRRAACACGP
jgi:hypothetical protein